VRKANAPFAVIGFQQVITAQPQKFANELAILARILNHQNPRHAPPNTTYLVPAEAA